MQIPENRPSGLHLAKVEVIQPVHTDQRRQIVEFYDQVAPRFGNLRLIRINGSAEGFVLGQHYHLDTELFFLGRGAINKLILTDPETQEQRRFENLGPDTLIQLPPRVAHTFHFTKESDLWAANENPHDPANFVPYHVDINA